MGIAHINTKLVRDLAPPANGNTVTWDDEVKGFGVRITAQGAVSFVLRYVIHGRERRYTIGNYPALSPTAAREKAIKLRGEIAEGRDPLAIREDHRSAPTVADLCDRYLKDHSRPKKRPSSVLEDESMIARIVKPKLGARKVADIIFEDIDKLHQQLKETPYRANRALSLLSKMFALAIRWHIRTDNPCRGVERFHEEKRQRYLKPEELQRLVRALAEHSNRQTADAVRLLLMTGARRGEVLAATWDQFDFDRGEWVKASAHTKQKREHRVPLSAPALALLAQLKDRHEKAKEPTLFLFPSPAGDTPQRDLKRFWRTICARASIKGVRVHDLRHSFASYLASAGASLPLIGEMLGHTQASTTHRYTHLLDDPKRKAANRVGKIIAALERAERGAEVVPLRRVRKV